MCPLIVVLEGTGSRGLIRAPKPSPVAAVGNLCLPRGEESFRAASFFGFTGGAGSLLEMSWLVVVLGGADGPPD